MKFCFFSAQYLPTVGGVERYTNSLATELIKKGHQVVVVSSALCGLPHRQTEENGIEIFRLPVFGFMGGRFPVLKLSHEQREFSSWFQENKPDFCVIQTHFYFHSLYGAYLAKKNGVPSIVIEHGTAHLMRSGVVGAVGSFYEHLAATYLKNKNVEFYGVSQKCCEWLGHFGIETQKVLYNAAQVEKLNDLALKGTPVVEQYIKKGRYILFAGRFIPEKGVLQLVKAFEQIKKEYDISLIMAGDGALWQPIKDMEIDKVELTGQLGYNECLALIKSADIFCLPTFSEGFATTVLEAAALKTAIITTPTGGSPEIILNENYGILMDGMEQEDIYRALKKALGSKTWCETAAENAYRQLVEYFTWDAVSDKLINIVRGKYENTCDNPGI
ncbi:MAG: glycosyltransferase family 4 protein [Oscillospiraceae bacterium]